MKCSFVFSDGLGAAPDRRSGLSRFQGGLNMQRKFFSCVLGAAVAAFFTASVSAQPSAGPGTPGHGFGSKLTGYVAASSTPPEVHLTFDGDYSDSGRRGNDGTNIGGVALSADNAISGMAAVFDGTGRVIVGPADGSAFVTTGNHSFHFWARIDAVEVGNQALVTHANIIHPTGQGDEDMMSIYVQEDGILQHRRMEGSAASVTPINDGQWWAIGSVFNENDLREITRDGDPFIGEQRRAQSQNLYINGVFEANNPDFRLHTVRNPEGPLSLGAGTEHMFDDGVFGTGNNHPFFQGAPGDPDNPDNRFPSLVGAIDEFQIIPGSLTAEQIADLADQIPANAPDESCSVNGVSVSAGIANATTTVDVDVAGDDCFVAVSIARQGAGGAVLPDDFLPEDSVFTDSQAGPVQGATSFDFFLPAADWVATAYAYADLRGLPAAPDGVASDVFTVDPLPTITGPVVYETPGGAGIALQQENYSLYAEDTEADRGPLPDGINPAAQRGPFSFFQSDTKMSFGAVMRRDGGFDRVNSGWLTRYDFDLDWSGGEEGTHAAWTRALNAFNTSDFVTVTGDPDDQGLSIKWPFTKDGGYNNGNHRINEYNTGGPRIFWSAGRSTQQPCVESGPTLEDAQAGLCLKLKVEDFTGEPGGRPSGHIKEFQDGENEIFLAMRQAGPGRGKARSAWIDMWNFHTDVEHVPDDIDIIGGTELLLFVRGDCNGDGQCDISDGIAALGIAFLGDPPSDCMDGCDFNASGSNDITNAVYFFNFKFGGGPPLPKPTSCNFGAPLLGCSAATCNDSPHQSLPNGPDGGYDFTPLLSDC
jgi:hypothetical protein